MNNSPPPFFLLLCVCLGVLVFNVVPRPDPGPKPPNPPPEVDDLTGDALIANQALAAYGKGLAAMFEEVASMDLTQKQVDAALRDTMVKVRRENLHPLNVALSKSVIDNKWDQAACDKIMLDLARGLK